MARIHGVHLQVSKPHFANHALIARELGADYGVASCRSTWSVRGSAAVGALAKDS